MAEDSKIVGVLNSIEEAIETASKALDDMNNKALKGGLGFDTIIKSVDMSTKVFNNLTKAVGELGSAMTFGLDFGMISGGFSKLSTVFNVIIGGASKLTGILDSVGQGIDSVTGFSRSLNSELFASVAKFNGSFKAAKEFSDYIISSAQEFATAEKGFISPADRIEAIKSLAQAGIPMERLTDIITSTAGEMDLLNAAFLHSKAIGMDLPEYFESIGQAIKVQGLTSQQAMEQMAEFGDTSQKTGLRLDKVARSLQGISSRFAKLGITANFGKPILEGFTSSLTSMGLGFENAIDLTENLSSSLAKLTSDYSTAFVTFQRGGLDFGSGQGALGASIGLRAEMLKANETGDSSKLGVDLAKAVGETISSFTGGQIINVKQAAENPALQQTFFTQTQLLKDLYGITEAAEQDRVLELLQQLQDASKLGNKSLSESLGQDIQEVLESRDETLGYAEKTAKFTEATFAELHFMNKNLIEAFKLSGDSLSTAITDFQKETLDSDFVKNIIEDLNASSPDKMKIDFNEGLTNLVNSTSNGMTNLSDSVSEDLDRVAMILAESLSNTTLTVSNPSGDSMISNLKYSIDALTSKIGEYLNAKENSKILGY